MEKNKSTESTDKELSEKLYTITFYLNSGSKLSTQMRLSDERLETFIDSINKEVTRWLHHVLPSATYLVNLANIDLVEIVKADTQASLQEKESI